MIYDEIREAVIECEKAEVVSLVRRAIDEGYPQLEIINEALTPGMRVVGDRFGAGEYFVPEMMLASIAVKEAMKIIAEHFEAPSEKKATVVIGTVKGDLHDIGKNMVSMLLEVSGFNVIDLGVDVSEADFVDAVREHKAHFLGLSALITTTMPEMVKVMGELEKAGLRDQVTVMVGGAPVSQQYCDDIGADFYGRHAATIPRELEKFL